MGVPPIYLSNEMEERIAYLLQEILRSFKKQNKKKKKKTSPTEKKKFSQLFKCF